MHGVIEKNEDGSMFPLKEEEEKKGTWQGNKLSKKGSSEKDQVRERVPRVPRVSGKFWKASKRQSDMEKMQMDRMDNMDNMDKYI